MNYTQHNTLTDINTSLLFLKRIIILILLLQPCISINKEDDKVYNKKMNLLQLKILFDFAHPCDFSLILIISPECMYLSQFVDLSKSKKSPRTKPDIHSSFFKKQVSFESSISPLSLDVLTISIGFLSGYSNSFPMELGL